MRRNYNLKNILGFPDECSGISLEDLLTFLPLKQFKKQLENIYDASIRYKRIRIKKLEISILTREMTFITCWDRSPGLEFKRLSICSDVYMDSDVKISLKLIDGTPGGACGRAVSRF